MLLVSHFDPYDWSHDLMRKLDTKKIISFTFIRHINHSFTSSKFQNGKISKHNINWFNYNYSPAQITTLFLSSIEFVHEKQNGSFSIKFNCINWRLAIKGTLWCMVIIVFLFLAYGVCVIFAMNYAIVQFI